MKVLSLLVWDHVNPLILIPRVNSTLVINAINLLLMLASKTLRSAHELHFSDFSNCFGRINCFFA